jgi:ribonuclease HI
MAHDGRERKKPGRGRRIRGSLEGAIIEAWFDGVCEPRNPGGHAAWGALVKVNQVRLYGEGGYVGVGAGMSNNVAEYCGCIAAMEWIRANAPQGIVTICGDSKLVINQLAGHWRVLGGAYVPYYTKAFELMQSLLSKYSLNVNLCWVPREENSECDELSKQVLRARGVQFRIQPEAPAASPSAKSGGPAPTAA